ncbi:RCC1 domain-containing protein [Arcanobacterium ihumii]|uniref:RCC1 domain-containing protein n=1 Tax=Arcanobacterium ihumii TaxID=2138162 RepID=UPI000F541912|nr:hypothetical protein [Arcanobacterium ihumii]
MKSVRPTACHLLAAVVAFGFASMGMAQAVATDTPTNPDSSGSTANELTASLDKTSSDVSGGQEAILTVSKTKSITFTDVAAGDQHSLAVASDGRVYAWGYNSKKQVGQDSGNAYFVPTATIPQLIDAEHKQGINATFTHVAAGSNHSLGLGISKSLFAWGTMSAGTIQIGTETKRAISLGDISTEVSASAVQVELDDDEGWPNPVDMSAGKDFSLVRNEVGNLVAWGKNQWGQLGIGCEEGRPCPMDHNHFEAVEAPDGVSFVSSDAGAEHAAAVTKEGKIYAWGRNTGGLLGVETKDEKVLKPAAVTAPADVKFISVSAGSNYTLALASDGSVYGWGKNTNGQLGIGTSMDTTKLTKLSTNVKFKQIAAGFNTSAGVSDSGDLYTWGGQSSTPEKLTDPKLSGLTFSKVSVGNYHGLALATNGKAFTWGDASASTFGVFGDGKPSNTSSYVHEVTMPTAGEIVVNDVYFGKRHADVTSLGEGKWKLTIPSNEVGVVDVTVEYTVNGVRQSQPIVISKGFTYTNGTSPTKPIEEPVKPSDPIETPTVPTHPIENPSRDPIAQPVGKTISISSSSTTVDPGKEYTIKVNGLAKGTGKARIYVGGKYAHTSFTGPFNTEGTYKYLVPQEAKPGSKVEVKAVNFDDATDFASVVLIVSGVPTEQGTITFSPSGGTWSDGSTSPRTIVANVGDTIQIPEAPVKPGMVFDYWQGSHYTPGESYVVQGDHSFTAIWKNPMDSSKIDFVSPTSSASDQTQGSQSGADKEGTNASVAGEHLAHTGSEDFSLMRLGILFLVSGAVVVLWCWRSSTRA